VDPNWFSLLVALALLLPPIPFPSAFRKTLRRQKVADAWAVARLWQNWGDLARAALGVYVLMNWAFDTPDPARPGGESLALLAKTGVLGLAILAQTVRVFRSVQLLAPVFYLSGLTCFFGNWIPGLFAVGVGWLFALGGRNLAYQLPAMAIAVLAGGYVLGAPLPTVVMNGGLILIPPVLAVLFRKRLLFASYDVGE
jgi:hypothetical protein